MFHRNRSLATRRAEQVSPAQLPELLRIAAELQAHDRAQVTRAEDRQMLLRAAAEAGIPPEYLEQALVELKNREIRRERRVRQQKRMAAAAGIVLSVCGWWGKVSHRPTPTPEVRRIHI